MHEDDKRAYEILLKDYENKLWYLGVDIPKEPKLRTWFNRYLENIEKLDE